MPQLISRSLSSFLVSAVFAAAVQAQPVTRFDTALVRTATLGSLVRAGRAGDSLARFRQTDTLAHAFFDRILDRLSRPALDSVKLQLLADHYVSFRTVLRKQKTPLVSPLEAAALDTLAMLMEQSLPGALNPILGRDSTARLLDPLDAFNAARRSRSMAESNEKLKRFERKYGPGSPVRNGIEVGLNYVAQFVPLFQPNAEGWPSRVELIASYVPTYVSVPTNEAKSRPVTVAEVGPRLFIWKPGWGGAKGGVLRPGFVSFGVAVAGERDGALVSPFKGTSRFGGFFGWGNAKVAVIGGHAPRLLVTHTVHVIPFVF